MILIAGDHDEVTQAVARQLLDAGLGVRLLVDAPTTLALLGAGAQVALHHSGARMSVQSAFDDVTRLYLPACRAQADARTQIDCIDAATALSIPKVVKVSGAAALNGSSPGPEARHVPAPSGASAAPPAAEGDAELADRAVEHALSLSPLAYTVVRHSPTFQDLWFLVGSAALPTGGMPDVAAVDAEDVAMVVLDSLVDDVVAQSDELVTGPARLSAAECWARIQHARMTLGAADGEVDTRMWRRWPWRESLDPSIVTDAIVRVTGEEPTSFESFLERKTESRAAAE